MSAELSEHLAGWDCVRSALAEIHACHDESERFFSEMFDELGRLSSESVRRRQQWESERRESETEFEQQWSELEEQRTTLSAQQAQFEQTLRESCDEETAAAVENDGHVRRLLEKAQQERAQLREAQEAVQQRLTQLADLAGELSDARNGSSGAAASSADHEQLTQTLEEARKQQASLEQERAVLQAELESVRNRAAETAESLAEQKRQVIQQQAQWSSELKRMRCLLESMSGRSAERDAVGGPPPAGAEVPEESGAGGTDSAASADPALDSVMAQFEVLQRDLARRRAASC